MNFIVRVCFPFLIFIFMGVLSFTASDYAYDRICSDEQNRFEYVSLGAGTSHSSTRCAPVLAQDSMPWTYALWLLTIPAGMVFYFMAFYVVYLGLKGEMKNVG